MATAFNGLEPLGIISPATQGPPTHKKKKKKQDH